MSRPSKSFLVHALTYGGGTLLLQAASILLLPLYTAYLSPSEFGLLDVLNRLGDVLCICLMVNGISKAATAFHRQAEDEQERKAVAATIVVFLVAVLVGVGLLVLPFAGGLSSLLGVADPALLRLAIVTALLQATTVVPLTLMQARLESGLFTLANLGMFLVRVTLTIVAVSGLGWGVWGVLGATAFTSALAGLLLTWHEFHIGTWHPNLRLIPEVVRYALPFLPAGLFTFLILYSDRFLLLKWAGQEQLGLYSLGARLAEAAGMFSFVPLQRVWNTAMFDAFERSDASLTIGRMFTRVLGSYVFLGLGVCLLKDTIIYFLGAKEYQNAAVAVDLLVLAHYFWFASNFLDAVFYVRRQTRWKVWLNLAAALVTIPLFVWLIPQHGALGAAFSLLIGASFYAGITWLASQTVFHVRYEPGRLAAMLGLAVILVLSARTLGTSLVHVPARLAIWAAWPIGIFVFGLVSPEEKQYVRLMFQAGVARLSSRTSTTMITPERDSVSGVTRTGS